MSRGCLETKSKNKNKHAIMEKRPNLALIAQLIESAEKSLRTAKQLLIDVSAGKEISQQAYERFAEKAQVLSMSEGGKIVEGVFDGQNMIGPEGKQYPVPANYASKSKLVEGDVLKLTVAEDGSFIYKQIGPVERKKVMGILLQDEKGDYRVIAEGKTYRVLLASITYFKAEAGDEITVVVPEGIESQWAAVENVIKKALNSDSEMSGSSGQSAASSPDSDGESDGIIRHTDNGYDEL
jgi:hypothetical protein